jgi:hypothetical protein
MLSDDGEYIRTIFLFFFIYVFRLGWSRKTFFYFRILHFYFRVITRVFFTLSTKYLNPDLIRIRTRIHNPGADRYNFEFTHPEAI